MTRAPRIRSTLGLLAALALVAALPAAQSRWGEPLSAFADRLAADVAEDDDGGVGVAHRIDLEVVRSRVRTAWQSHVRPRSHYIDSESVNQIGMRKPASV